MDKKLDIKIIVLFLLIGVCLFGIVGYKAYNDFFKEKSLEKKLMSLDLYGYTLTDNDTTLYKTNFKELEKVLNEEPINYEEYAKSISKLFIIDVFTLNNKLSSTEIGGLEFVNKDLQDNFKENLGNTLYKSIKTNLDGKRKQDLPIVSSIEVTSIDSIKYTYNKTEYDGYEVKLNWDYTSSNNYQKSIKLTLINDNNILYIVKGE